MNRIILTVIFALLALIARTQCTLLIEPMSPGSGCFDTSEEVLLTNLSESSFVSQTLSKTSAQDNWGAGAFGYNKVFVNGSAYTIVGETNTQRVFGLSGQDGGTNPNSTDFAFRLRANGNLQVFESGNIRANTGNYNSGDTLRIKNDNGTIKYYRNSELLYESSIAPEPELYIDISLRTPGSTMSGLSVENVAGGSFQAINYFDLGIFNFFTWTLNGTTVGGDSPQITLADFDNGDVLICEVFAFNFSCFGFTNSNSIQLRKPDSEGFSYFIEGIYDAGSSALAAEQVVWKSESLENVVANGNNLLKVQSNAWDGNAASHNTVKEGGYFEFTATETNERRVAGLSSADISADFNNIGYAFYLLQNGTLRIYESGVNRGLFGSYSAGSIFRIEVEGGFVRYYHDDALLRTTALNETLPMLVDVSIRDVGGTISDAQVVNRNSGGFTASAAGAGPEPDFQWRVNGADVGTNSPTYSSAGLLVNDQVTCVLDFDFMYCDPAPVVSNVVRYLGADNTTSWTGAVDSDWNRTTNWSNGIPTETISARIPAGTPNDPLVNTSAVVKNLDILAGAQVGFTASNSLRICGDFDNRGTFNAGSGTVSFSSTGTKTISGAPITFNRLMTNTASVSDSILLETEIRVSDETVFIRGIIYTQEHEVVYLPGSGSREGLPISHVDGTCRKIGNTAFRFPTGRDGVYAPITISAPAQTTDAFRASYFETDPELAGYSQSLQDGNAATISRCEYWILDRVNGNSVVSVTLSYEDLRSCEVNDPSELLVMRWDGTQWNSHGYLTHTGNTSTGTVTSGLPILNFSPFTLGSGSGINPLPIELAFFEAKAQDDVVLLEWATYSELNNAFFTLERSGDGIVFHSIGQVSGQGNATSINSYAYTDDAPMSGGSYYRLVQTDFDGASEVFPMQYVFMERGAKIQIFPNPSDGLLTIDFSGTAAPRSISVLNLEGKTVLETDSDHESVRIDLRGVSKGVYIIEVKDRNGTERFRHIIQ